MKFSLSFFTVALMGLLVLAAAVSAEVPTLTNYQGRLTDGSGVPVADGSHEVTFRIYDETSTQRWSEVHNVTTSSGLFSVQLGSNGSPLTATVLDYAECWLGITVTGDPEITPRTRLTAVPYATQAKTTEVPLKLRKDWSDISYSEGVVEGLLENTGGGTDSTYGRLGTKEYGVLGHGVGSSLGAGVRGEADILGGSVWATLGDGGQDCAVDAGSPYLSAMLCAEGLSSAVYGVAPPWGWAGRFQGKVGVLVSNYDTLVVLDSTTAGGGAITTWGPGGSRNVRLSHMVDNLDYGSVACMNETGQKRSQMYIDGLAGNGGFFAWGPNGSSNVGLLANGADPNKGFIEVYDDVSSPQIRLYVEDPTGDGIMEADQIYIQENGYGDQSANLPANSISAYEMLNEPGIAQNVSHGGNTVITASVSMIDVIVVSIDVPAAGYIVVEASAQARFSGTTTGNYMSFQIDATAGGSRDVSYYHFVGFSASAPSGSVWLPVSARRTYWASTAGTYTYRLEAIDETATGDKAMWNPVITAQYFPTSYGTVATVTSAGEAGQFTDAQLVSAGDNGDGINSGGTAYVVDLRELELKAVRLRAEAAQAERDLMAAQMQATTVNSAVE